MGKQAGNKARQRVDERDEDDVESATPGGE